MSPDSSAPPVLSSPASCIQMAPLITGRAGASLRPHSRDALESPSASPVHEKDGRRGRTISSASKAERRTSLYLRDIALVLLLFLLFQERVNVWRKTRCDFDDDWIQLPDLFLQYEADSFGTW